MTAVVQSFDVVFALALLTVEAQRATRDRLSEVLGTSETDLGEAMARLRHARLVGPTGELLRASLLRFVEQGAPHCFPAAIGPETSGVSIEAVDPAVPRLVGRSLVWPHPDGPTVGAGVEPLDPRVPGAAIALPALGSLLSAADLLRLGGARNRQVGAATLRNAVRVADRCGAQRAAT